MTIAEYQHGSGLIFGATAVVVAWTVVAAAFAILVHHVSNCTATSDKAPTVDVSPRDIHLTLTSVACVATVIGASITGYGALYSQGGWATLCAWVPWLALLVGGLYFHLVHRKW
ncbi:hypothetical protein [Kitasatospora sp. NPDC001527]|uniref:hypothetical protein n=1 Tax=Kitasatospora sp. NPDC001527 TaxID=3154519 RepID=UPI0033245F8C